MNRLSLRGRLVATTVAAALVAVTILVVGVQLLLARQSARASFSALRSRADAAASTVQSRAGRVRVLEPPAGTLDQNVWVFDTTGKRVDGAGSPPGVLRVLRQLGSSAKERSVVNGSYRLLARPVDAPHGSTRRAVVVVGLDLHAVRVRRAGGLLLSLGLGLLTVVAAGGAAWAASGYALHQVRRMAHRADEWREHDLSGRFALGRRATS